MVVLSSRFVLGLALFLVAGCGLLGKKRIDTPPPVSVHQPEPAPTAPDKAAAADTRAEPKQLAMVSHLRESKPVSPSSLIPPPPEMTFPEIPPPPPKDYPNEPLAPELPRQDPVQTEERSPPPAILQASATRPAQDNQAIIKLPETTLASPVKRAVSPAPTEADIPTAATESNLDAVRRLHKTAVERLENLDGFETRLTRREVINNRPQPEEVMQYRFRRAPFSVHMKWIGKEGTGRELTYCQGKFDNKVNILTARGDGAIIVPAGIQKAYDPDDSTIRSRSRYDFRQAGMSLSLNWIGKVIQEMDRTNDSTRLRYLGKVTRPECKQKLEGIEEIIPPGWEPLLPRGGKRLTFFDSDMASPSYGLPILVMAYADNRREVEYYFFEQLRPATFNDSDFDPRRLWRK